jgi:hypothetical protein
MAQESGARAIAILRRLAAGAMDARQAAGELVALNLPGLAAGQDEFTPEERSALDRLLPEVRWEMAKRLSAGLPDVPYGSPEYEAWRSAIPRVADQNGA